MESKPAYQENAPEPSKGERICGLSTKWFWTLVALILAICIGVGVGVGVGVTRNNDGRDNPANTERDSQKALEDLRNEYNLPALAVGKSIMSASNFTSQVAGVRKQGDPTPALRTDQFHLGSNTKAMTATLLAFMIEEGVGNLTWTTTLAEALPAISNMSQTHRSTSLEMLTSHRSGIYDERMATDAEYRRSLFTLSPVEGRRTITQRILSEPAAKAQGTYTYENVNYILAGMIIDIVTNTSFEEAMQMRLFEPLGMTTAGFGPLPERGDTSIDNPRPHTASASSAPVPVEVPMMYRDNSPAYGPAGRAHCTMADYDKFLRLHLDGVHGRINSSSPFNLSTAGFRHLHTASPGPESGYTYGGWQRVNLTELNDYKLSHTGSNTMNYARAEIYIGKDAAYMAFTNVASPTDLSSFSTALGEVIDETIEGTLLGY